MSARAVVALVARREIGERLRSKAFLASTLITLLIVLAVSVLPALFDGGDDPLRVAAGDPESAEVVAAAAQVARGSDVEIRVVRPRSLPAARTALAEEELDALVVGGAIESREALEGDLPEVLQAASARVRGLELLSREAVDPGTARSALAPEPLALRPIEAADPDEDARAGFAFVAVLVLYGQLFTFAYWVASGVVEEKASRVVEVILAAIAPWQLLAGKIVGLGILGFVQLLLTVVLGVGAASLVGSIDLNGDILAAAGLALVWFVLGYLFYACAFACAGAIVPRQEELQSSITPLTTAILVSFFVAFSVVQNPDGLLAVVASFIPFTAPMVMPPLIALGEASLWQVVGAVVVTAGCAALLVPLAARIYAGAVLRTGSTVKLRDAYRAARA